jgi:hypothetical protein
MRSRKKKKRQLIHDKLPPSFGFFEVCDHLALTIGCMGGARREPLTDSCYMCLTWSEGDYE